MPDYLCITGTDTDAGKTFVTAGLARAALKLGRRVLLLKPVQTGVTPESGGRAPQAPDVAVYLRAAPGADARALALFTDPCSPHLAARREGRSLDAAALAGRVWSAIADANADLVLIEGAGGLLTPLNDRETLADLFAALRFPLLLVTGNKLGAVNHALLSLEATKARGLAVLGTVMSAPQPAADELGALIRDDNASIIAGIGGAPCLADLPWLPDFPAPEAADRLAALLTPVLSALAAASEAGRHETRAGGENHLPRAGAGAAAPDSHATDALTPESLLAFDREHIWHPYTSALHPLTAREAVATQGTRIRLRDGRELVDGMASWWCAVHGYRHPYLMKALREQAARMPHVMFGGLTHEPAVRLAGQLVQAAPPGLERVFFSDSGSVAVEVAVKMAVQYHQALGNPRRRRLVALRGAYHGDTIGAMSLCDPETGMHRLFTGVLPEQLFAPRPECRFDRPYDPAPALALENLLREHGEDIAALVLEPVVQGAGGMWMYHPDYLARARELCDACGCLLVADEIATGFGRTGRYFACEHAGVTPDILCVGKALTGGVMGFAATLATNRVALGISEAGGVFMHGPTFMGNPLACAVASASLDLLADGGWRADVARIEAGLRAGLEPCRDLPGVADVRVLGAVGVLEMKAPVNVEAAQDYFVNKRGVWIRPFGRLIYVMPPYISSDDDIALLTSAMRGAAEEACRSR